MSAPRRELAAKMLRWSASEDAALREAWPKGGWRAAQKVLPHRTETSIIKRAWKLGLKGIRGKRPWTPADDRLLRELWEEGHTLAYVAKRLGRTPMTTYQRASWYLKLTSRLPEGREFLHQSAERLGFGTGQLRRILGWARVRIYRVTTRQKAHRSSHRFHTVDAFDAEEAVEKWLKTEPVETAARRLGMDGGSLQKRLLRLGHRKPAGKQHWRVTEEQIREALQVDMKSKWASEAPRGARGRFASRTASER